MTDGTPLAIIVVMPCHNRASELRRTLDAYAVQSGADAFEVVAVDDGSSDNTLQVLEAYRSRRFALRVVALERNSGPAAARNRGVAEARAPLVLFSGDDIVPGYGFVSGHLEGHAARPGREWAVLGHTSWPDDLPCNSLMRHIDGVGAQQFSYGSMRDGEIFDFRHFYTSNVSVKAKLLEGVEPLFDTSFLHAAYEDVELAYRLERDRGLRIAYSERPVGHHYHYYSSRAFAVRQERCGHMSAVLVGKHPELKPRFRFDRVEACAALAQDGRLASLVRDGIEHAWFSIEDLALALAGTCELADGPAVDQYYRVLFEYFVLKGMIVGWLDDRDAITAAGALAVAGLAPHVAVAADRLASVLPQPSESLIVSLKAQATACERNLARAGLLTHAALPQVRAALLPAG